MQRIGLERLARGLFGDAFERARAEEIDQDGHGDNGKSVGRRLDHMGLPAEEPAARLIGDACRQNKKQGGFGERGHALDLAVAILVLGVGRLAGDAHRGIREHRRGEVEKRVSRFRQDRQRAGHDADDRLGRGQRRGGGYRSQRGFFLVVHAVYVFDACVLMRWRQRLAAMPMRTASTAHNGE